MIKIYTGELLSGLPHTEILYPNLGNIERETPFGEKIFASFTEKIVEIVETPEAADYFCIPHNFNYVKDHAEYLAQFDALAQSHSKRILIFYPGDSDADVPVKNGIVFRNSQYGYKVKENEIIMPAYACDLGEKYGIVLRPKIGKPVVGFCGWASYRTTKEWVSYGIYNVVESLVGKSAKKKGLYFRRRALAILKKSSKVITHFVVRTSYSGNTKTISLDPTIARSEYVNTIKNSDFTLAPKGDGNFSVRFFEALSLGRIPLLIDTDCSLPLEDEIDYDSFILRVDHKKIDQLPHIVADFYEKLSPEEYLAKQKKCREVFEKYLKIDAFFKQTITREFLL